MGRWMAFLTFPAIAVMAACSGTEPDGTGAAGGGGSGGGGSGGGGSGGAATTSSTGNGVAGPGCPDLRGTFQCPLTSDPSEYTLTVQQTFDGQATTYQFHYSHTDMTATFAASAEGISNAGNLQKCTAYQGVPSLAFLMESAPDTGTYNFINAGNDYQSDYTAGGSVTCVRSE